jgi:hypothetical protein
MLTSVQKLPLGERVENIWGQSEIVALKDFNSTHEVLLKKMMKGYEKSEGTLRCGKAE